MSKVQEASDIRWRDTFETGFMVIRQGMASVAQVFTHRRMGAKYLNGMRFFTAMLLLVFITQGCTSNAEFMVMYWLGYAVIAAWVMQHIDIVRRRRKFDLEHSQYNGWPRLCDSTGWSEDTVKLWLEPFCVAAFGVAVAWLLPMPGVTFALAGACMGMNRMDQLRHERIAAEEMFDAELYGAELAGGFRRLKGVR